MLQKCKGRAVLHGDVVTDDAGSFAVLAEQGSSASHMKSRQRIGQMFHDFQDAQNKQATQYRNRPQSTWRTLHIYEKIKNHSVRPFSLVYLDHDAQNVMGQNGRCSCTTGKKCVRTPIDRIVVGTSFRKVLILEILGRKYLRWECLLMDRGKALFLSVYVVDIKVGGWKKCATYAGF